MSLAFHGSLNYFLAKILRKYIIAHEICPSAHMAVGSVELTNKIRAFDAYQKAKSLKSPELPEVKDTIRFDEPEHIKNTVVRQVDLVTEHIKGFERSFNDNVIAKKTTKKLKLNSGKENSFGTVVAGLWAEKKEELSNFEKQSNLAAFGKADMVELMEAINQADIAMNQLKTICQNLVSFFRDMTSIGL